MNQTRAEVVCSALFQAMGMARNHPRTLETARAWLADVAEDLSGFETMLTADEATVRYVGRDWRLSYRRNGAGFCFVGGGVESLHLDPRYAVEMLSRTLDTYDSRQNGGRWVAAALVMGDLTAASSALAAAQPSQGAFSLTSEGPVLSLRHGWLWWRLNGESTEQGPQWTLLRGGSGDEPLVTRDVAVAGGWIAEVL